MCMRFSCVSSCNLATPELEDPVATTQTHTHNFSQKSPEGASHTKILCAMNLPHVLHLLVVVNCYRDAPLFSWVCKHFQDGPGTEPEPETGTVGTVLVGTERGTGTAGTAFQEPQPEPEPYLSVKTMFRRSASLALPHLKSFAAIPSVSLVQLGHTNRSVFLSHESQREIALV